MAKEKKGFYTVQSGDSWESIAGKVGAKDQRNFLKIMQANGGFLKAGMQIRIPGSVAQGNAFISNKDAAAFGYATSGQIQDAYNTNGTGGYNSGRLPLGGMGAGYGNAPATQPTTPISTPFVPGMTGQGAAQQWQQNNPAKPTPSVNPEAAAGAVAGLPGGVLPQWQMGPFKPPIAYGSRTGQSAAQAWQATQKPQQNPPVAASGFVLPKNPFDNPLNPQLPTSGYGRPIQGPPAPGQNAPFGMSANGPMENPLTSIGNAFGAASEWLTGKTTLNPDETMSVPGGKVAPKLPGASTTPPPKFTPAQTEAATQKIMTGMGTQTDLAILRSKWVLEGKDPGIFDKQTQGWVKDSPINNTAAPSGGPTSQPASLPDSATGGWNNPSGPGYTSPSGYFIPYARKTNFDERIYDYKTGKYKGGKGGNPKPPPQGIFSSGLTTGLITWRY